jgi:large subunit ribosomal protein L23
MKLTSFDIIKKVRITEKGMRQTEKSNQYTFVADRRASAPEIKVAVQELFKVTVNRVNTCNMPGKERRKMTKAHGWSGDWKKAMVTLKAGDKIDLV